MAYATVVKYGLLYAFVSQSFMRLMGDEKMRFSSLGPAGFKAFTKAFLLVNGRAGKLTHFVTAATVHLVDDDLEGLDALWMIALEVLYRVGWLAQ